MTLALVSGGREQVVRAAALSRGQPGRGLPRHLLELFRGGGFCGSSFYQLEFVASAASLGRSTSVGTFCVFYRRDAADSAPASQGFPLSGFGVREFTQ